MFCTSLRKRPSFAPGIAGLASAIGVREHQLNTHDLEIPFASSVDPKTGSTIASRRLRVLLLGPHDIADTRLARTLERISHFGSLTGGEDVAIIFLLYPPKVTNFVSAKDLTSNEPDVMSTEGIASYSKLQVELLNDINLPNLPILHLTKLDNLPTLLKKHMTNIGQPKVPRKPATTTFDLLKLCTASPPMPDHTAYILSDLFTDLRDLAETCTAVSSAPGSSSPSTRLGLMPGSGVYDSATVSSSQSVETAAMGKLKRLRDLVGEQGCMDVVDFWKEEWMID